LVLYVYLSADFFFSFFPPYSWLKTYLYYTEIYNNRNSERRRSEKWTTMARLNLSPQATGLLPSGERSSVQREHNKRKQNGCYLFFLSMWMILFFYPFFSLFLFQPTKTIFSMTQAERDSKI